jgi:hypothetical protein
MIGLFNVRPDIQAKLEDSVEVTDATELSGLFIDWLPKHHGQFPKQAAMVEEHVKRGIPAVVYDRYMVLTNHEYNWLSKFNVTFFEPAINYRPGFEYFPQWMDIKTPLKNKWEHKRDIDLAYDGLIDNKVSSFEKYYKTYASLFPDKKVAYGQNNVAKIKVDEWTNHNLHQMRMVFTNIGFTILIGTHQEYSIGYLREDLYDIMMSGCIPLCPREHRFFGSMFKNLVVDDERDVDYLVSSMGKVKEVVIEEVFENILNYYPEFHIDYAVEKLKECLQ